MKYLIFLFTINVFFSQGVSDEQISNGQIYVESANNIDPIVFNITDLTTDYNVSLKNNDITFGTTNLSLQFNSEFTKGIRLIIGLSNWKYPKMSDIYNDSILSASEISTDKKSKSYMFAGVVKEFKSTRSAKTREFTDIELISLQNMYITLDETNDPAEKIVINDKINKYRRSVIRKITRTEILNAGIIFGTNIEANNENEENRSVSNLDFFIGYANGSSNYDWFSSMHYVHTFTEYSLLSLTLKSGIFWDSSLFGKASYGPVFDIGYYKYQKYIEYNEANAKNISPIYKSFGDKNPEIYSVNMSFFINNIIKNYNVGITWSYNENRQTKFFKQSLSLKLSANFNVPDI